jgi:hypothetical protein
MLNLFEAEGKKSSSNQRFKFWSRKQSDGKNHPVLPDSDLLFNQKLNYLHWNPVTAGFVNEPWHWKYSSAIDYMTKDNGLLDLVFSGVNDYGVSSDVRATGRDTCAYRSYYQSRFQRRDLRMRQNIAVFS